MGSAVLESAERIFGDAYLIRESTYLWTSNKRSNRRVGYRGLPEESSATVIQVIGCCYNAPRARQALPTALAYCSIMATLNRRTLRKCL